MSELVSCLVGWLF